MFWYLGVQLRILTHIPGCVCSDLRWTSATPNFQRCHFVLPQAFCTYHSLHLEWLSCSSSLPRGFPHSPQLPSLLRSQFTCFSNPLPIYIPHPNTASSWNYTLPLICVNACHLTSLWAPWGWRHVCSVHHSVPGPGIAPGTWWVLNRCLLKVWVDVPPSSQFTLNYIISWVICCPLLISPISFETLTSGHISVFLHLPQCSTGSNVIVKECYWLKALSILHIQLLPL